MIYILQSQSPESPRLHYNEKNQHLMLMQKFSVGLSWELIPARDITGAPPHHTHTHHHHKNCTNWKAEHILLHKETYKQYTQYFLGLCNKTHSNLSLRNISGLNSAFHKKDTSPINLIGHAAGK